MEIVPTSPGGKKQSAMHFINKLTLAAICGFITACSSPPQSLRPSPLDPAPVAPVSSSTLPPLAPAAPTSGTGIPNTLASSGQDLQAIPTLPTTSTGVVGGQAVTVGPQIEFSQNAVLGSWNVSAEADTCALNLSLTTWTGGFRASTRKCNSEILVSIGAWKLSGKELMLLDAKGGPIARLITSGPNRFDGTTDIGGKAISVFR